MTEVKIKYEDYIIKVTYEKQYNLFHYTLYSPDGLCLLDEYGSVQGKNDKIKELKDCIDEILCEESYDEYYWVDFPY